MSAFVDFAALKQSVSIEQAIEWLGIQLKKEPNGQLRGCCPIHAGKNPREFVVTPSKGLYFCFAGCGGGDILKLTANVRKIGTKEAAQAVAEHFGNRSEPSGGNGRVPTTQPNSTVTNQRELQPLSYLEPEHELVQALNVSPDTCTVYGAGFAPKGIMRGRLAIPIHDREGKLLAYTGRSVKNESPTLIFPNGFDPQRVIFNAHRVTEGELYLVRDPLQVLTAYESGIENVVAFLTEGIAAVQFEMLSSLMDEKRCESAVLF